MHSFIRILQYQPCHFFKYNRYFNGYLSHFLKQSIINSENFRVCCLLSGDALQQGVERALAESTDLIVVDNQTTLQTLVKKYDKDVFITLSDFLDKKCGCGHHVFDLAEEPLLENDVQSFLKHLGEDFLRTDNLLKLCRIIYPADYVLNYLEPFTDEILKRNTQENGDSTSPLHDYTFLYFQLYLLLCKTEREVIFSNAQKSICFKLNVCIEFLECRDDFFIDYYSKVMVIQNSETFDVTGFFVKHYRDLFFVACVNCSEDLRKIDLKYFDWLINTLGDKQVTFNNFNVVVLGFTETITRLEKELVAVDGLNYFFMPFAAIGKRFRYLEKFFDKIDKNEQIHCDSNEQPRLTAACRFCDSKILKTSDCLYFCTGIHGKISPEHCVFLSQQYRVRNLPTGKYFLNICPYKDACFYHDCIYAKNCAELKLWEYLRYNGRGKFESLVDFVWGDKPPMLKDDLFDLTDHISKLVREKNLDELKVFLPRLDYRLMTDLWICLLSGDPDMMQFFFDFLDKCLPTTYSICGQHTLFKKYGNALLQRVISYNDAKYLDDFLDRLRVNIKVNNSTVDMLVKNNNLHAFKSVLSALEVKKDVDLHALFDIFPDSPDDDWTGALRDILWSDLDRNYSSSSPSSSSSSSGD